jgi:acetylornithine aminotransferase/acetylornithine/N-succinyldiaminopimelate aminotransferase
LRKLAERHPCITDVRGKGVMIAAELNSADLGKHTVTEMLKHRVVINCTSDTTLRFLPPYIFERVHVDTTIAALDKVFTAYAAASSAGGENNG